MFAVRRLKLIFMLSAFSLACASLVLAQSGGSIRGTITDQSGAVVAGVLVTITSSAAAYLATLLGVGDWVEF